LFSCDTSFDARDCAVPPGLSSFFPAHSVLEALG
jgi:hypothetical protein